MVTVTVRFGGQGLGLGENGTELVSGLRFRLRLGLGSGTEGDKCRRW